MISARTMVLTSGRGSAEDQPPWLVHDLGFMAITAAPEPVSEVDALYFLRPVNGRLVLRNELRIGVKFDEQMAEA